MKDNTKHTYIFIILIIGIIALFLSNLFIGSVDIPFSNVIEILLGDESGKKVWKRIILESRLPQAITALFTGAGLAVSGLLLQTVFRNPLADSGILGISAGASLGVAIVILMFGGVLGSYAEFNFSMSITIVIGAFIGAAFILAIIMFFSSIVRNSIMLLIIGIMVGYLTSSAISLLKYWGGSEKNYSYMIWGMGDFSGVTLTQLPFFCSIVAMGLVISIILIKPLNAILLGEKYAVNLGVNIKVVRMLLLLCAGLLTAITTAYCGPIAFIGLAVPHMARLLLGTADHKTLLPCTILIGSAMALLCNLISMSFSSGIIPLNAITPIFGAPVIIYVIVNQKRIQYFN